MKTDLIHISEKIQFENSFKSVISFKKFIDFLKSGIQSGPSIKVPYFKWIIKKFKKYPELSNNVPLENLGKYEEMLELVSTCLLPLAADENMLWALSSPLSPQIFYSTDGFHKLMECLKHPVVLDPAIGDADSESEKIMRELQYGMLLEKVYSLPYLKKTEWIRKFEDPETGLDKYFQVNIDTRFIDIRPIEQLPAMDCTSMSPASVWGEEFKKIQRKVPLNQFEARGFSIVTLTDVTAEQAIEQVGKLVIHHSEKDKHPLFDEITHALQTVVGSRDYQFGLVPFLSINDRPALVFEKIPYSIILQACWNYDISKKEFSKLRNDFTRNPRMIIWSAGDRESHLPEFIGNAFREAGIGNYIMFPIYHHEQVTGFFEVSTSSGKPMLSEAQMVRLKPVLPIMTQLIQDIIARFNQRIESIIKEKFTSIQPAVQWKFNEAAWHYLRDHDNEEGADAVENIIFKNLHPLYGAVDIRNSTILRNQALEKDYAVQLGMLINVLTSLNDYENPQLDRILTTANNWRKIIQEPLTTQQEVRLNEFFNMDVEYELENLLRAEPEMAEFLIPYFQSIDEENGIAFENRRLLELAIKKLNSTVNNFYENASVDLLNIFPCYFEKFRTDGVEYDIYAGQSIVPHVPFKKEHLQEMKRWQLKSMIQVVHLVQNLAPEMDFPLQTTQLLFAHPQTIDITFRKDERRFDVEGAYNIRYHIIKKRIDKVLILDTNERLTQPGKIALVYFDERDAEEFKGFISELQNENLLLNDLEELDLETLQGVDGLKAIRVGVRMENISQSSVSLNEFEKSI
ncbi:MAG TPA: GAF domain-containing protein [Puia sp.]|nr:GAF domain-containing protein [Puia sp.]